MNVIQIAICVYNFGELLRVFSDMRLIVKFVIDIKDFFFFFRNIEIILSPNPMERPWNRQQNCFVGIHV